MRFVPVLLLLAHVVVVNSATAQPAKTPRLDVHGDPLPEGAVVRLGSVRFQPPGDIDLSNQWWQQSRVVALSPDGTTVATAGHAAKGTRIHFMDAVTGKNLRKLDLDMELVAPFNNRDHMQFTPDGKALVFSGYSRIHRVNGLTGEVDKLIDVDTRESRVALSADGTWLAAQPQKNVYHAPVGIWETKTGKEVASLPGRGALCKDLAFSADGKRLLLCSMVPTQANADSIGFGAESKVALACIDINLRKIIGETTVGTTQYVALCPDGETVALEAADHQSVRVRHLPTGAERCSIPAKQAQFVFARDGKVLVTIDAGGRGALWDATKGNKLRDLEGALANKDFLLVGISTNGRTIAALDGGWHSAATVVVWNAATGKRMERPAGHEGAITALAYAPDGKLLASGSIDKTVRLWNPATGEHVRVLTVHPEALTAVAFSADGKLLASSSQAGVTRVSSIADGKVVTEVAGPAKGATALTFSPDGKILFAGGKSAEVLAWEIAGGKEIVRLQTGHDGAVMAFADGGSLALTAGERRGEEARERLQVWQPTNMQPVTSMSIRDEQRGQVYCAAAIFSPAARLLASSQVSEYQGIRPSYGAAMLRLWERASGQPIRTLSPAITGVLAFSPNGRLLASGAAGTSGHLRVGYGSGLDIWDILTGKKVAALPLTPACMAFSPDGLQLATGGRDHALLIWEAPKIELPKNATAPSAAEREAWWNALGGDAKDAYPAMGRMLEVPEHTVAFLKERVRPVATGDPDTVAKLIVQLDGKTFSERMEAESALEKMGEGAAHLLKKALEGKVSLELQRRLEALLSKCEATSRAGMQHHRTVALLEWIGTPAARALLRTLADGAPRARLTIEAQAAKRLQG